MTSEQLIALNDEIAGMARAGLPLDQGLAALAKEMGRGQLRSVTQALAADLQSGQTLPGALERQKGKVPPYYASLVAAGVRTGRVGDVLSTLTTYARSVANLRVLLVDAFFYPAVVVAFGVFLFLFMGFFLLPQIQVVYRDFGFRLPWLTALFLKLGDDPVAYLVVPLVSLVALCLVVRWGFRVTAAGRMLWAQLLYAIPILGTLLRAARLASFTELLSILVDHETPLPEAFRLAGDACSDPVMTHAAREIEQELLQGKPLGQVLRGRGLVPEWVAWMTALGEQRGTLAASLRHVATMYRRQVELRTGVMKGVLPSLLIVVLAGGFVLLALAVIFAPMLRLLEGLSQ